MYAKYGMHCLQSLHGHESGIHVLILDLKFARVSIFLKSSGNISHSLAPSIEMDSIPKVLVLTLCLMIGFDYEIKMVGL